MEKVEMAESAASLETAAGMVPTCQPEYGNVANAVQRGCTALLDAVLTLDAGLHCTTVGLIQEQDGEQREGVMPQVNHNSRRRQ
jgi:hypothetical protein